MSYKNKLLKSTIVCYLPIVVLFATIRLLSAFGVLNFLDGIVGNIALNLVIQVGLLFCVSIFLFAKLMKTNPKNVGKFFGFRKISAPQVGLSVLIGIVVYILNVLITTFFNAFLSALGYTFSSGTTIVSYPIWLLIVNLLLTAVLPGICEEVAHRGLLLNGLSPLGGKKAIIISAFLFGLLHLNIEQFFYATLIGLLIGFIALRCESIYPAMIIHFMNNAISVIMGYSSFHSLGLEKGFGLIETWLTNSPILGLAFMVLLIIALLMFLKFLLKYLIKFATLEKMNRMQRAMVEQYEKERYLKEVENISIGNEETISDIALQAKFFEDFDNKYNERALQIGLQSDINYNLNKDKEKFQFDKITKIMLITTFAIVGILTFFTFIWGLL